MKKFKLFIENILVYGFGGAMSMAIPVIMVPIVTRLMPNTADYGLNDLANTLITFTKALAVMGMYDAMYRMFFEKDDRNYKRKICSTALVCTTVLSVIIAILLILLSRPLSIVFFEEEKYYYLVIIAAVSTLTGATNTIVAAPTRMENKRKIFLMTNTLAPILSYGVAIPLILCEYYIIALPLAGALSGIIMELVFLFLNHTWFSFKLFDVNELIKLLKIAIPIMPSLLFYWVFNSCDRLMIANYLGTEASGIYAVGAKLGMASQLIYLAFSGGWQYFAFSTMKEKNQVESNSMIFEYLGIVSYIASSAMCIFALPIYRLLFTGDYVGGYIVAPYLFMAPLMQMLFQVVGNQFLVIKKTWPTMLILLVGVVVNLFMNIMLIPVAGIEGAAIATLFGYVICVLVVSIVAVKTKLMFVSIRFILLSIFQIFFILTWRCFYISKFKVGFSMYIIFVICSIILYHKDIKKFGSQMIELIRNK